jgi:hypothetical protein
MPVIVSYKVGVTRSQKSGPSRWLSLKFAPSTERAQSMSLFFYEKDAPGMGFHNRETAIVVANLPVSDFEPMYKILNTENPVFAHFRVHSEDDRLLSVDISTSEEPVGEGPVDRSP